MPKRSYDGLLVENKALKQEIAHLKEQVKAANTLRQKAEKEKNEKPDLQVITQFDFIKALRKGGFGPADLGWYDYQTADFTFDGEKLSYLTRGGQRRSFKITEIREFQL